MVTDATLWINRHIGEEPYGFAKRRLVAHNAIGLKDRLAPDDGILADAAVRTDVRRVVHLGAFRNDGAWMDAGGKFFLRKWPGSIQTRSRATESSPTSRNAL